MRYWWVNQNQTYRVEIQGRFMWSPKTRADGSKNPFYDTMQEVAPGDVVFSFCDTFLKAVGVVTGFATTGPKPDFGTAGSNWSREGWYVPVDFCALEIPLRPKDHISTIAPLLPKKYAPLRRNGNGLQNVYLAEVPAPMADELIRLIGDKYFEAYSAVADLPQSPDVDGELDEATVVPAGATFRDQLVKARRGQGVFRSNVLLVERECRVTRVNDPRHLRASHIKPWREASDTERLSGANGLLLSPHVDHLFDQGYVSFSDDNRLLVVPGLRQDLLEKWGIDAGVNVGEFNREQRAFLAFHQANIFGHQRA